MAFNLQQQEDTSYEAKMSSFNQVSIYLKRVVNLQLTKLIKMLPHKLNFKTI